MHYRTSLVSIGQATPAIHPFGPHWNNVTANVFRTYVRAAGTAANSQSDKGCSSEDVSRTPCKFLGLTDKLRINTANE
jgi:hypothetical protein